MKKLTCAFLSLVVLLSATSMAFAVETPDETSSNNFWVEMANTPPSMIDDGVLPQNDNGLEKRQVKEELKNKGLLSIDDNQHLAIAPEAWDEIENLTALDLLAEDYAFANEAIDDGILYVEPETLNLYNCEATEETLQRMKDNDMIEKAKDQVENSISLLAAHSCSYKKIYFGSMVSANRVDLQNYLRKMQNLANSDPTVKPGVALTKYWIGKVQPGGIWDYKTVPGYSPYNSMFCLTYGKNLSKANYHRTSEFMGNYNYGFTGRMMFPLSFLKLGSNAVGGNVFIPDADDYPAIEEGYSDAG